MQKMTTLYSLVFDVNADSHGGKELVMDVMTNAQLRHRRVGHLNKKSLELMQRRDGNGSSLTVQSITATSVPWEIVTSCPKKAKYAAITAPFQLFFGDLMGPVKLAVREGYEYVSKTTDPFTKWTAVYLLNTKDQALASV